MEYNFEYSWQYSFKSLPLQGVPRMIELIKIILHEIPRLQEAYASGDSKKRSRAKNEVAALFTALNEELVLCQRQSKLSPEEFAQEIQKLSNFTPAEQRALLQLPPFLKTFGLSFM